METSMTSSLLLILIVTSTSMGTELTLLTSCTCLGYEVVYECSVNGGGATIWQGTTFEECGANRIVLRHSEFGSEYDIRQECGDNGQIVGSAHSIVNDTHTSHLTLNVSQNIVGKSIECSNSLEQLFMSRNVSLTTAPLPPPNDVQISYIGYRKLIFSWNSVLPTCQAVYYKINATNCGECPNTTDSTSVTCKLTPKSNLQQTCMFKVKTMVCGNISGVSSDPIFVTIKVPESPQIKAIPEYSGETNRLKRIIVHFNLSGEVYDNNVTDDSYTINFMDSATGSDCYSAVQPVTACENTLYMCKHTFEVISSSCQPSADILVSVFVSNAFGDGLPSNKVLINSINKVVEIDFNFDASIAVLKCTFQPESGSPWKSCAVKYGPNVGSQCKQMSLFSEGNNIMSLAVRSDSVSVLLDPSTHYGVVYCYHLTASNGRRTVTIVGKFTGCNPAHLTGDISVPSEATCASSYSILGIENGFVCYSGTKVGATAVYYCLDCGYNALRKSTTFIRTCGENGLWNETISQCDCKSDNYTLLEVGLYLGLLGAVAILILTITLAMSLIVIVGLYKSKRRLKQKLNQNKDIESKIYEEVEELSLPPSTMETSNNVAYVSCQTFVQSISCIEGVKL